MPWSSIISDGTLWLLPAEWYFRSSLDRYVWIHGMMIAYLHPFADAFLQRVDSWSFRSRWAVRGVLLAGETLANHRPPLLDPT